MNVALMRQTMRGSADAKGIGRGCGFERGVRVWAVLSGFEIGMGSVLGESLGMVTIA